MMTLRTYVPLAMEQPPINVVALYCRGVRASLEAALDQHLEAARRCI